MRLPEAKIEEILKSLGADEPIVQALRQVFADFIADEVSAAINSNLTAEGRAYNCGRAASVSDLRSFLADSGLPLEHKTQEQA